jgi:hypothetical protein
VDQAERRAYLVRREAGVGTAYRSTLTFSVPMVGSGSLGVAPGWAPLIRACGVAQVVTAGVKVEYAPITDAPESATLYFDIDGTKHVMLGTRGTVMFKLGASGIPMLQFTLTSLFTVPAEAAKPTPDYTQFVDPEAASKANTRPSQSAAPLSSCGISSWTWATTCSRAC